MPPAAPQLGAALSADGRSVTFAVLSPNALRVELWTYAAATGQPPLVRRAMQGPQDGVFSLTVPAGAGTIYYGYRAWGPNWIYDPTWTPGSSAGFGMDVDQDGNRFNPNKLLLDPYALEVSHCVQTPARPDRAQYNSGAASRSVDTGPFAPKGIVMPVPTGDFGAKPGGAFKDDIIYEVHPRGLTGADPTVPAPLRGTYAGAALRARYLAGLGITAVEFMPVHQTQNALNDLPQYAAAHNYWGYDSMSFLAPDRRYASDQSPGGPTREWIAMVKAFHDAGLKVFIDVVFNHHEEGDVDAATATIGTIYSPRGLNNQGYYERIGPSGPRGSYENNNSVGPNVNAATTEVRDLLTRSLVYWSKTLGVDGFRFDLAAILGNGNPDGGYSFQPNDPDNLLNRAVRLLPARPPGGGQGVDLIAEPYTADGNGQEQGQFPFGWSEWNDRFRDTVRASQNKLGIIPVTPGTMATRFAGSDDLFRANGRKPWNSVNYVVCHDGFTLQDLHSYLETRNNQTSPLGPSSGGRSASDEMCWNHGGDAVSQQEAVRLSLALLMLTAGVPMITGGTEFGHTQFGNNNPFNLDIAANWLDWTLPTTNAALLIFTQTLIGFRRAHPALRPADFFTGQAQPSGIKDLSWLKPDSSEVDSGYFVDPDNRFLAWQLDGSLAGDPAQRMFIAYNGWINTVLSVLPALPRGQAWKLVMDTSCTATGWGNIHPPGQEAPMESTQYGVGGRSCILAIC